MWPCQALRHLKASCFALLEQCSLLNKIYYKNGLSAGWQQEKMGKYIWNANNVKRCQTLENQNKTNFKKYTIYNFKINKGKEN